MTVLALPAAAGDWLKHESDPRFHRERATIASTGSVRTVPSGTVLGRIAVATPAAASAAGGNTGTGVLGAVTVGVGAIPGAYRLEIFQAEADGGAFAVTAPDGRLVGLGRVGVAFAGGGLAFTLADGGTDFAAGDAFAITVSPGSGKLVELDPAGTLGTAVPAAVLVDPVAVPATGDAPALALARGPALVRTDGLIWPEAYETDDIAAGLAALARLGIVARAGA